MPVRAEGSAIYYYDDDGDEWLAGTIVKYIRGYGYTVSTTVEGEDMTMDIPSKQIKTTKPGLRTRTRSRSRSRSRSLSRDSRVSGVLVDDNNFNEESIKARLESVEEKIEEKVEETVAEVKSPRGRPKQRRSLVDWAWENVEGKAERTTRDRRSLSRERAPAQPVGQIVESEPEKEPEVVEVVTPAEEEKPAEVELSLSSCPWVQRISDFTHAVILTVLFPVITLKYYDIAAGTNMLGELITWRQYWTSQPFIWAAAAPIILNRFLDPAKLNALLAVFVAAYAKLAPQQYAWKWIPACAAGHLVTVYVLAGYVFKRHMNKEPNSTLVERLKLFVVGAETSCRVQDDMARMGNLIGILISSYYLVNFDLSKPASGISALFLTVSLALSLVDPVRVGDSFGLRSLFKHLMFVPFLVTLLPRMALNTVSSDFTLTYVAALLFIIGVCQKLSSLNRSVKAPWYSDALVFGASTLLGPVNVVSGSLLALWWALH